VYVLATLLIGVASAKYRKQTCFYLIVSHHAGGRGFWFSGDLFPAWCLRGLALHVDLRSMFLQKRNAPRKLGAAEFPPFSFPFSFPVSHRSSQGNGKVKETMACPKAATFGFPPMRPPERQWMSIRDIKIRRVFPDAPATPTVFRGTIHFALIPPPLLRRSPRSNCVFQGAAVCTVKDAFLRWSTVFFRLAFAGQAAVALDVAHEIGRLPRQWMLPARTCANPPGLSPSDLSFLYMLGRVRISCEFAPTKPGISRPATLTGKATAKSGALKGPRVCP